MGLSNSPALANIGGTERCDALQVDAGCASNGVKLRDITVYPIAHFDAAAGAEITDKVFLDISSVGRELGRIEIGLFGRLAPKSAAVFRSMCEGKYDQGNAPLGYAGSTLFRVNLNEALYMGRLAKGAAVRTENYIDNTGRVRARRLSAADSTLNGEEESLPIDQAGLLLMKKGGGTFEFVIKPAPGSPKYLVDDYLVVGQVTSGMDVIARLNFLPVNQPTPYKDSFILAGKLIKDKRATAAADDVNKPLTKTVIRGTGLI
ncbi:Peptidyl-prolyl cis-trans isomerase B [Porphyridium purpureum]|uniref:Peptidyl-prolyl cis-trans isomerase B n=1 Tax=Porphyridium purpureum TaxID=35688 RepID=A0A5J4YP62_PORPP|nr:Peptidyl-prolyl cis-trans isomerase B [Porphyridium purpureum]|eukprot:POR8003..scf249_10